MKKVIPFLVFVALVTNACAAQTAQNELTAMAVPSHTPAPTSTSTPAPTSTITLTPTPSLPTYGVIDPNVGEKLMAEGIVFPEELKNPDYYLDPVIELQKTNWAIAYGIPIPITVIPERGIAYGKYHIKGIGATQDALNEYAKQHIKIMWMHYREFGNPADREITLEQYVELLKAGRGGFEIPQYNPETGFFDKKAMVNPLSGYVKIISDNTKKELPLKMSDQHSALYYVDENGMVWIAENDSENTIESWLDPNDKSLKDKPYKRSPNLANDILSASDWIGMSSNQCLATSNASAACLRDGAKVEAKYIDFSVGIVPLYKAWLAKYEGGDHSATPPMWIEQ